MPRRARHPAAGMSARTAKIEPGNRHPVISMTQNRPGAEQLIQRQPPVEDVAADQAEASFQIARPQRQPPDHRGLEARRVGLDRFDHQIGHRVAMRVRQIR